MNHLKYISHRSLWCQLKRLQSSLSNSTIKIPPRIDRGPTDILHALQSTVQRTSQDVCYYYQDDPYLLPSKKIDSLVYALSYEAGLKTAMWIHKKHGELFPKHLSEPQIEAFKPPTVYINENDVSEEILLQAISQFRKSDAIHIYNLLKTNVSNETKQSLLELLCFYNDDKTIPNDFFGEMWYIAWKRKRNWQQSKHIDELYNYLIKQDSKTAATAYNAMICGLARYMKINDAWNLFDYCQRENIPLNVNVYNYIIVTLLRKFGSHDPTRKLLKIYDIFNLMNSKGVQPNVRTLNAALKVITLVQSQIAAPAMRHFCMEFKKLNIKFSLITYYYILEILLNNANNKDEVFMYVLRKLPKENLPAQDPEDMQFFSRTMRLVASKCSSRKCADMLDQLLNTDDNWKFLANSTIENTYYHSYLTMTLVRGTLQEFFEVYDKIVPKRYIPPKSLISYILQCLQHHDSEDVMNYVPKIWSDIETFGLGKIEHYSILLSVISMDSLPDNSPLRSNFVDIALSCWNKSKMMFKDKLKYNTPIGTSFLGHIVMILLCENHIDDSIHILTYMVKEPNLFISTITENQLHGLFEKCILKNCVIGAFLLLEYAINYGFKHTNMAITLHNLSQLTDVDRRNLINLVGEIPLPTLDTSKSC